MKKAKKIIFIILGIILGVIVTVITVITLLIFHENKVQANSYNLPTETVKLKSKSYYSLFDNTKINWFDWGFDDPIYKVKESNPYNDYWIINDSQSVVVDLWACVDTSDQKIYVNDKSKIPNDYYSDKISSISLANNHEKEVYLDLTAEEIIFFQQMVFADTYDQQSIDEITNNQISFYMTENVPTAWFIKFHIKDLDGLYYYGHSLNKSIDGTYYITNGYTLNGNMQVIGMVPSEIGEKIDKAFQEQSVEF